MTSCLRSSVVARTLPGNPGFVVASFDNVNSNPQPFPWRFNKQTQAIDLEYVDGFTATTAINEERFFFRGQQFGALHLVLGLGSKFIQWCETELTATSGSVQLYEKPIVVNANMITPNENPDGAAEAPETTEPISFESADGSSEGKYFKTLVFMKPMVIKYIRSGTTYYRAFTNNFEGNT
jgi:hypothetical protein